MLDDLKKQRTYALVGHGGTGKTSLAEMLLAATGASKRLGKVDDGTTVLDYEPEEHKRAGSVQPGFAHYQWKKNPHYLIDAPGDGNFTGDLPYILTAADSCVLVVDAVDGAKPLTRRVWRMVQEAGIPAMCFISKMDRDRADFQSAYDSLSEVLGLRPVLMYAPIGAQADFTGVVDVFHDKALMFGEQGAVTEAPIPDDMAEAIAEMREATIENIAESDDALMEKYLEEGELSEDDIRAGLSAGVRSGDLVPVCVGSGLENKGAAMVLDLIQDLMPDPLAHPDWEGEDGSSRASSPDEPTACFVFKTIADPFAGHLSMMRVLSGTVAPDTTLANPARDGKERIGQPLVLKGKEQTPIKEPVGPGAVIAVAKLKNTTTGDTLADEKNPFLFKKPDLPPQLITFALAAAEKGDEDKVYQAIQRIAEEDVTLSLGRDEESADILLSGMGQLHIETVVEKAKRRYKVEVVLKPPKVPYRETIAKAVQEIQGRHKKQSGGRGQFGDCWIHMEPLESGGGYEFADQIVGGAIPRQYIPAVDKGIQEAAVKGPLAGYPMVDFKVTCYDGSYHSVDSSEMAFKVAGSLAFKKACEKAGMKLLEPVMLATVTIPDEYMGDVIGDLSSRRGRVLGSDANSGVTEVRVHVPMAEMLRYAPDLRSMTGGQGTFTMEFDHYAEAPQPVVDKVVEESRAAQEG